MFYDCAFSVNCVGRSGGLCILWKSAMQCTITRYSQNHIDVCVNAPEGNWRLTGFYGYPDVGRRKHSWALLKRLAQESNLPWIVIVDFNDILTPEEKKGGANRPNLMYTGFREAILDCNLADVPLNGHPFTWSWGKEASYRVDEKLDRAMGSPAWHARFQATTLTNLVMPISEHSPILLDTSPTVLERRVRNFRFENKWLEEPDIGRIVSNSWEGFKDFGLLLRLKATGEVLDDWGKHIALAWIRNKRELEDQIDALMGCTNQHSLDRLLELKSNLAKLLISEEKYRKQRAKAHWLKCGDLNTRFYHQVASARKKRNKISGLHDDNGT